MRDPYAQAQFDYTDSLRAEAEIAENEKRYKENEVTTTIPTAAKQPIPEDEYYDRIHNLRSFAECESYAAELTERTGRIYLPCDYGSHRSPRFEAVLLPQIGDPVSKSFNGDSYPEGYVVSISPTYKKISTSTGVHFYRVGRTGSWRSEGTWWLARGHVSERNPSF